MGFNSLLELLLVLLLGHVHRGLVMQVNVLLEFLFLLLERLLQELSVRKFLPSREAPVNSAAVHTVYEALHNHAVTLALDREFAPQCKEVEESRVHQPFREAGENYSVPLRFLLYGGEVDI